MDFFYMVGVLVVSAVLLCTILHITGLVTFEFDIKFTWKGPNNRTLPMLPAKIPDTLE